MLRQCISEPDEGIISVVFARTPGKAYPYFMRGNAAVLLASLFYSAFLVADDSPAIIENRRPELPPLWVRADVAINADGTLRDIIGRDNAARLQQESARPQVSSHADAPCKTYHSQPSLEHFLPTDTAEELLSHAQQIMAGKIIATSDGFYLGTPGQLHTIQVTDTVTGAPPDLVYLFYPHARIVTPTATFCSIPIGTKARPTTGDRVLIFSMLGPDDIAGRTFRVEPGREMAVEQDGLLLLPKALRRDDRFAKARDITAVIATLRSMTAERNHGPSGSVSEH